MRPTKGWPSIRDSVTSSRGTCLTLAPVRSRGFRFGAGVAVPSTTAPQPRASAATTINAVADPNVRMTTFYLGLRGGGGQRGDEGVLRNVDPADSLHPLLAFLLLLQQFALAGDVAA